MKWMRRAWRWNGAVAIALLVSTAVTTGENVVMSTGTVALPPIAVGLTAALATLVVLRLWRPATSPTHEETPE